MERSYMNVFNRVSQHPANVSGGLGVPTCRRVDNRRTGCESGIANLNDWRHWLIDSHHHAAIDERDANRDRRSGAAADQRTELALGMIAGLCAADEVRRE